jgi:two-component sensor histidine kinase
MFRDITERKVAEERIRAALKEKEVLLKEIYHRVKNNLQVVSSLLSMQGSKGGLESRGLLEESANRVQSMALVHEQLYQSQNLSSIAWKDYAEQLLQHLRQSNGDVARRVTVRSDVDDIRLGIETAIPLGLIVNELISNAYKHAFPGNRTGEIVLRLKGLEGGAVALEVNDDGVGLPEGFEPGKVASLGMQLVVSLAQQLDGQLDIRSEHGARFALRFVPDEYEAARLAAVALQ